MSELKLSDAQDYLNSLHMFQWLNLSQVPINIQGDVYNLLDTNRSGEYSIIWHELYPYLFMKVDTTHRSVMLRRLKELESGIGRIHWIHVKLELDDYIVMIGEDGRIVNDANEKINLVFKPTTHILEHFDWLYKHARTIELKYRRENNDTESEETEDTG